MKIISIKEMDVFCGTDECCLDGLWVKGTFTMGFFVSVGYHKGHNGCCCCCVLISNFLLRGREKSAAKLGSNLLGLSVYILKIHSITAAHFTLTLVPNIHTWELASVLFWGIGMLGHVPHIE